MVEDLSSGVTHLFKPPHPKHVGRLLENSWRLRSPGQKRGGPARLAELRPSRVFYLVQNAVHTPLESLAGHDGGMLTAGERGVYQVRCLERLRRIVPT